MSSINPEWFAQYMKQVSANVKNKDGDIRFSYAEMRTALDAVEQHHEERVPSSVADLFRNIVKILPPVDINERQETTLLLALLNCHMAYWLISERYKTDGSIG